jgi:hypothetical protein
MHTVSLCALRECIQYLSAYSQNAKHNPTRQLGASAHLNNGHSPALHIYSMGAKSYSPHTEIVNTLTLHSLKMGTLPFCASENAQVPFCLLGECAKSHYAQLDTAHSPTANTGRMSTVLYCAHCENTRGPTLNT